MDLLEKEKSDIVAKKARETFEEIKKLRKTMPQKFGWQKEELEKNIKELQDKWWQDVKHLMIKEG